MIGILVEQEVPVSMDLFQRRQTDEFKSATQNLTSLQYYYGIVPNERW